LLYPHYRGGGICHSAFKVLQKTRIKRNYKNPVLTDQEAWNVAAFIESQPRKHFDQSHDWKDLKKKPIDLPFGPYIDQASEKQHKYGPFKPILEE
jgi:cytochrome c